MRSFSHVQCNTVRATVDSLELTTKPDRLLQQYCQFLHDTRVNNLWHLCAKLVTFTVTFSATFGSQHLWQSEWIFLTPSVNSCVTQFELIIRSIHSQYSLRLCFALSGHLHHLFTHISSQTVRAKNSYRAHTVRARGTHQLATAYPPRAVIPNISLAILIALLQFVHAKLIPSSLRSQYSSRCYSSYSRNSFRAVYARNTHRVATVRAHETHSEQLRSKYSSRC